VRLILLLPIGAGFVNAQEGDEAWRDLLTRGQRAVSANQPAEAEQLFLKALHEAERFGSEDRRVGSTLQALGETYRTEKKLSDALPVLQRALDVVGKNHDDDSVEVADARFALGEVLLDSGRASDAVINARRALMSYQSAIGGRTPQSANAYCLIGDSLRIMRNFIDAEEPLRQCADIREQLGGIDSLGMADASYSLALAYVGEKKYQEADPRFSLAEKIREHKLGITSSLLAQTLEDHAAALKMLGNATEAEKLLRFAQAIRRSEKKKP